MEELIQHIRRVVLPLVFVVALALPANAEEGGSAHYTPGSTASFIDAFPGQPGALAVLNLFTFYGADTAASRTLPLGGFLTAGMNATVYADTVVAVYQLPWELFDGGGIALGLGIPYVWVEVEGQAQRIGPDGVPGPAQASHDTDNGIGDITLVPLILGWGNTDLKLDLRLSVFAPTGKYEVGKLANVGKNYWTFEPGFMASWIGSKTGTEVGFYTGVDFNTKNRDRDYTSGSALHFDLTLAQHLPLGSGLIGAGANAFYYHQISGDSGSEAVLGDFAGTTIGVGPVASYVLPIGTSQLLAELKWLPELHADERLKGHYVWLKAGVMF